MNLHEIKRELARQAETVAAMLLPRGKRQGKEWVAGGTDGDAGRSLSVCVRGERAGVWSDFATGETGDLIDLWCATRGMQLVDALDQIRAYLGVPADPKLEAPKRTYRRPERPKSARKPANEVLDWLHARGLTDETIAAFKVAAEGTMVVFPFLRGDELVNVKRRDIRDKRKQLQEKDAEPCLFGWHLIDGNARWACITEGECDAMVLHQFGLPAMSVPNGASNHGWIESDWALLDRFETIFLCYDDDEPGQKAVREVANRLGLERCRVVTFPGAKDANDFLLAGGTAELARAALEDARTLDPEELVSVDRYMDDVLRAFDPDANPDTDPPLRLGEEELKFRYRLGEVTVYTGFNGHGKSVTVGQIQLGLMEDGARFCVFSGELSPKRLLYRYVRQATGMSNPSPRYIRQAMEWMTGRFWVYHVEGATRSDRLLKVFEYAARRHGVTHVVVDSMMMLEDVPEDGREALERQRQFMVQITALAKRCRLHVHLVAHPRKGDDERSGPGKQDVSGSGKITNMADNVVSIWARLADEGKEPPTYEDGSPMHDSKVEVLKQRNGEHQHWSIWGYYHRESMQFCRHHPPRPRRLSFDA